MKEGIKKTKSESNLSEAIFSEFSYLKRLLEYVGVYLFNLRPIKSLKSISLHREGGTILAREYFLL